MPSFYICCSNLILIIDFFSLSNNSPYTFFGATQAWDEEKNLWSAPHDISHTEADDDRILYNLIVVRERLDKDSEVTLVYRYYIHVQSMLCNKEENISVWL